MHNINWAMTQENLSLGVCEHQMRRKPAHRTSQHLSGPLLFAFLLSIISKLATSETSIF